MAVEMTTILVTPQTRDKLKEFWQHGDDNYDTVITRLIEAYEKKK